MLIKCVLIKKKCGEDKTVTIYFDICINVIIHWQSASEAEYFKRSERQRVDKSIGKDNDNDNLRCIGKTRFHIGSVNIP